MRKRNLNYDVFIQLDNRSLWAYYEEISGVFKGGGNSTHSRLRPTDNRLYKDLIVGSEIETRETFIFPNLQGGISFADSVETIEAKGITGHVWRIPKGTILPDGLVFNVGEFNHPLLNVSYQMKKSEFLLKLDALSKKLIKTNHVISARRRRI